MPNKLTDAEVKKALEHCADVNSICEDCVLFNPKDDDCKCSRVLKRNALDLINRYEEKNSNLQEKNSNLTSDLSSLQKDLTSAKAEVERLQATIDGFTDIGKLYSEIKAEAYKEFAERLKREKATGMNWFGKEHYSVNIEEIDNLLNELVGEEK